MQMIVAKLLRPTCQALLGRPSPLAGCRQLSQDMNHGGFRAGIVGGAATFEHVGIGSPIQRNVKVRDGPSSSKVQDNAYSRPSFFKRACQRCSNFNDPHPELICFSLQDVKQPSSGPWMRRDLQVLMLALCEHPSEAVGRHTSSSTSLRPRFGKSRAPDKSRQCCDIKGLKSGMCLPAARYHEPHARLQRLPNTSLPKHSDCKGQANADKSPWQMVIHEPVATSPWDVPGSHAGGTSWLQTKFNCFALG